MTMKAEAKHDAVNMPDADQAISPRILGLAKSAVFTFLLACLAWIVWNTSNAFPSVDDFCYSARAAREGVLRSVAIEYASWGGRYSATFLLSAFGQSRELLLHYYFIVPLSILLLNLLACAYFLRVWLFRPTSFLLPFFMTVLALFSFRETIFWMAGGYTYGIAIALLIPLIAEELRLLGNCLSDQPHPSHTRMLLLCTASIVLAGFNETVMVAHIALLLTLMLICLVVKRNARFACSVAALLCSAILGAYIVRHAPGNLVRQPALAALQFLPALGRSLLWIFERYTLTLLFSSLLFYSSLIIFQPKPRKAFSRPEFIAVAGMLFTGLWAALFARAYALGDAGPARAQAVDHLFMSLLSFFIAWNAYNRNQEAVFQARRHMPIFFSFLGLFIISFCLRTGPDGQPFREVLGNLRYSHPLKAFMFIRLEQAQQALGKALTLSDYPDKARPATYFDDVQEDPKDWRNACFATYFSLSEVRVVPQEKPRN
jgi:hypothetical protein